MQANELFRKLVKEHPGLTQNKIAAQLGVKSQTMSARVKSDNLKTGFFAKAMGLLGYRVVVVPAGTDLPKGSFVIGDERDVVDTASQAEVICDDIDIDAILEVIEARMREREAK